MRRDPTARAVIVEKLSVLKVCNINPVFEVGLSNEDAKKSPVEQNPTGLIGY